jgi:hypothetical protein
LPRSSNVLYLECMSASKSPTELDILSDLIRPDNADMTHEAARALLKLKFDVTTQRTITKLLRSNSDGSISTEDRLLLDRYLRVGQLIDLLQAKARRSLARAKA